ncbi:MAG: tRNA adenosine(34) deaminase TadA [Lachnospiraceae bacterium]|nr:tRNA adenosine(34) deaminase TadA [Lachnospiraceae bacterium]
MSKALTESERFMRRALHLAEKAAALGEVPIGCIIVRDGKVVGSGYNRRKTDHTTLAHAEMIAIRRACRRVGDWRLEGCTMYVTLEPCQMCAGALVQSRIDKVVIGCRNPKAGCAGSILNLLQEPAFNHQVEIEEGVLAEDCSRVLQTFFKALRLRVKSEKAAREMAAKEAPEA